MFIFLKIYSNWHFYMLFFFFFLNNWLTIFLFFSSSGLGRKYINSLKYQCGPNWIVCVINFNDMSTSLGLFYSKRFGNHIHCTFISSAECQALKAETKSTLKALRENKFKPLLSTQSNLWCSIDTIYFKHLSRCLEWSLGLFFWFCLIFFFFFIYL